MSSLDVPVEVAQLLRQRALAGSSMEVSRAKAHLRDLWNSRSNVRGGTQRWRGKQGQTLTLIARLRASGARDSALAALREAGRRFKANSLVSWRPYVLLALGLLGEPLAVMEALDPKSVQKSWLLVEPFAAKLRARVETTNPSDEGPLPRASGTEAGSDNEAASSSASDSGDSSSSSSSSDSNAMATSSCGKASGNEADHAPAGASSSGVWTARWSPSHAPAGGTLGVEASPPPHAPAGRTLAVEAPPPLLALGHAEADAEVDDRLSRKKRDLINKLLKMTRARPHRILGLQAGPSLAQVRKAYHGIVILVHPDKCDLPGAAEAFRIAHQAFEKLWVVCR